MHGKLQASLTYIPLLLFPGAADGLDIPTANQNRTALAHLAAQDPVLYYKMVDAMLRRALKARSVQPDAVVFPFSMVLHPTPQYSGNAALRDGSSGKKGGDGGSSGSTASGKGTGSGGGRVASGGGGDNTGSGGGGGGVGSTASSSSSSSWGDVRIRILSSWSGASVFAGVVFTISKSIMQPVSGDCSEWVTNTMMPAMIWVVTWMIEEGVYDDMAAAGGGWAGSGSGGSTAAAAAGGGGDNRGGSSSSSGAGTAAAGGGGGGGDNSGGSGSSSAAGIAAAAAGGGGGGGASALTEEAAAAHMVVLTAVARLLLVCSEGLVALEAANQPQRPSRASSSSSSGIKQHNKSRTGSSNSSRSTSAASGSHAGLVKVGRGGKSDGEIRCLEVFGALEAERCAFARLLGLGSYCLMKRLQQGWAGAATAATAATAADGGGDGGSSSSSQGRPAVAAAAAPAAAPVAAVSSGGAAAASKQGIKKATSKPAAPNWAGMVMTHLPETVVQALQNFENTQGLGFLQGLCSRLVRAYQEGVQKDGVGLMLPLADWGIFPKGYTGALLCDEVQMCAPLLADAPYRVACNYPGCENIEGGSEASVVKKCTGCGVAAYCSRGCQTEHWPEHKEVCKSLQKEQKEAAAAAAVAAGVQQLSF